MPVRSLVLLAAVVLNACRFDATIPAEVMVRCGSSVACPPGTGCRQPERRCEAAAPNDVMAPSVLSTSITYVAQPVGPVQALGLNGTATVVIKPSEALTNTPTLNAGPSVECDGPTWGTTELSLTYTCRVLQNAAQGAQPLGVQLFDLSGNWAEETLEPALELDTVAPPPLPAPLTIDSEPYTQPPFVGLRLEPGLIALGHRLLASTQQQKSSLSAPADGGVVELALLPELGIAVEVVDQAGNRSTPTPVTVLREALRGPGSPHAAKLLGSLGPARTIGRDWATATASSERRVDPIPVAGAAAWVRHRFELPPTPATFVSAIDDGVVRVVTSRGATEVWALGQGGFARLEGIESLVGMPPPVEGAAYGYDRVEQRIIRAGGRSMVGRPRSWSLTETWQPFNAADDDVVVNGMLEWSTTGLLFFGGARDSLDGGVSELVQVLENNRFRATPQRLPAPLQRATTAFETTSAATWVFGGSRGGVVVDELLKFTAARGFEVMPRRGDWPPPSDGRHLLVGSGGQLVLAQERPGPSLELRRFTEAEGFVRLGSVPLPVGGATLGWDLERRAFLLLGPTTLLAVDPFAPNPTAVVLKQASTLPPARLGASLTALDRSLLLVGGEQSGVALDEVWEFSASHVSRSEPVPARSRHAAWRRPAGGLVVAGGLNGPTQLGDVWERAEDGGWSSVNWWVGSRTNPETIGEAAGVMSPRLGGNLETLLVRAGRSEVLSLNALNVFTSPGAALPAVPVVRPQLISEPGERGFVIGEIDGGTATAVVDLSRRALEFEPFTGVDFASCYDPALPGITLVNGVAQGGQRDGLWSLDDGRADGGSRAVLNTRVLADAYGDRAPQPARESRMVGRSDGGCWLVNNRTPLELWELRSGPANAGMAFELDVSSLRASGERTLRIGVEGDFSCWVHLDGSWYSVAAAPSGCTFEDRFLAKGASKWRFAVTQSVRPNRLGILRLGAVSIETQLR